MKCSSMKKKRATGSKHEYREYDNFNRTIKRKTHLVIRPPKARQWRFQ